MAIAAVCVAASGTCAAEKRTAAAVQTQHAPAQTPNMISIRLLVPIGSGSTRAGDTFVGTLVSPLVIGNRIVAERDAVVTGQVLQAVSAGGSAPGSSKGSSITLVVRTVETHEARYALETMQLTLKEDSNSPRNVVILGGSAEIGAMDGANGRDRAAALEDSPATGSKQSAFLTDRSEIRLPQSTLLTFYLSTRTINPKQRA
jgi:hypothetical protein